jgi:hypothetical protein
VPEVLGRPRRRFYRMTPAGMKAAHEALDELSAPLVNPSLKEA